MDVHRELYAKMCDHMDVHLELYVNICGYVRFWLRNINHYALNQLFSQYFFILSIEYHFIVIKRTR